MDEIINFKQKKKDNSKLSPELEERLNQVKDVCMGKTQDPNRDEIQTSIMNYKHYLFAKKMDNISNEDWKKFIELVDSQYMLSEVINKVHKANDNIGDKVLVLNSKEPFSTSKEFEGYIGILESDIVTNSKFSDVNSIDGKIHRKIKLNKAIKLNSRDVIDYVEAKQMRLSNPISKEVRDYGNIVFKDINRIPLGTEVVSIDDKFPNVKIQVLESIIRDDEKRALEFDYDDCSRLDLGKYYGEKQIPKSQLLLLERFESDEGGIMKYSGNSKLSVKEIYDKIYDTLKFEIQSKLENNCNVESIDIYVAKKIKLNISDQQMRRAKSMGFFKEPKWLKMYLDDNGADITDETIIIVDAFDETTRNYDTEFCNKLEKMIGEVVIPIGFSKTRLHLSYGCTPGEDQTKIESADISHGNRIYIGEMVMFEPKLPCGKTKTEAHKARKENYNKTDRWDSLSCDYRNDMSSCNPYNCKNAKSGNILKLKK